MKPVLILTLLIAVQPLKSCGSLKGVGTQTPAPDASITTPCARPEAFLGAGDWAIIAGRIGDALIDCGENHKALVDRDRAMRARYEFALSSQPIDLHRPIFLAVRRNQPVKSTLKMDLPGSPMSKITPFYRLFSTL